MSERLPKFDNPPVFETVLGLTFIPLAEWKIPHIGLFWNRIRSQYPECTVQPPLPDEIETFGDHAREITFSLGPTNTRCWLISRNGEWLLQLQNSRFISNWRHRESGKYPNYKGFKEKFGTEWTRFKDFLKKEKIEPPKLLQAEVSYFNHIDIDEGLLDLGKVFPTWSPQKKGRVLDKPEAVAIDAVFPIPDQRGRLYIKVEPVVRHSDLKLVIQMTLTGRVLIASNSDRDMYEALQLAHDWVVSGFADFTSPEMHDIWKRQQ